MNNIEEQFNNFVKIKLTNKISFCNLSKNSLIKKLQFELNEKLNTETFLIFDKFISACIDYAMWIKDQDALLAFKEGIKLGKYFHTCNSSKLTFR